MKNRKIWVMLVGLFTALTSGFMGTTLTFAEENEASQTIEQPSYISDFPNQVGHWQDLVGTAEKRMILLVYGSQTRSKGQTSNLSLSILMHANNLQEILN
ncbi:polysaccharide lyase 8 [Enterococcus sp. DIV0836a]|nr:hypothetical protein UE7_00631 [Enterococcus faecalis EnGen0250]RBS06314.1 hypothetical protein EA85_02585 [Enterococcus faecalis]